MSSNVEHAVHDLPALRDRAGVFRDRAHAGDVLAGMLAAFHGSGALVLGIPAGGVPVAATVAAALGLELDVAVVSKVLLPWTTEAGYGAVAFDGSTWIDRRAAARFGLTDAQVLEGTDRARAKVARRVAMLRGGRPLDVDGRTVILVDDGIAAGSTLRAAIAVWSWPCPRAMAGRCRISPRRSMRSTAPMSATASRSRSRMRTRRGATSPRRRSLWRSARRRRARRPRAPATGSSPGRSGLARGFGGT
jgi:adenine/guanine phosphoribosyltransferase-like PRPP-binding protein